MRNWLPGRQRLQRIFFNREDSDLNEQIWFLWQQQLLWYGPAYHAELECHEIYFSNFDLIFVIRVLFVT